MTTKTETQRFGLIVIGDEVLNGARRDRHLEQFKEMIGERGHALAWHWTLPDDPEVITAHLRFSMARAEPVFVCGGIGATPDDHTRGCAAAAAGVALTRHPGAVALLEEKFGDEAYPHRILMAELPEGCALIDNPVNRIPGFAVCNHWFLPGFPKMAWPMAEAVLEQGFGSAVRQREVALKVRGIPESQLIPVMECFGERFPALKMFSLPHMGEDPHILLGFRGHDGLEEALAALREALGDASIEAVEPR
ncbi:molybdopterin-binding protein [Marichromatium purpuratum 984]|uniref:Molybdopterin-binding protein n=1 Tax=Marichromatium purpuratum 984 TaxID=765910 RepID=W0E2T9_MARPU|nr:molybdopterin-binding protein [Marichromatium purpuratum]AHF03818.1 molybdopterin-binding protein [Marichromatium purpuratum 984]